MDIYVTLKLNNKTPTVSKLVCIKLLTSNVSNLITTNIRWLIHIINIYLCNVDLRTLTLKMNRYLMYNLAFQEFQN